MSRSRDNKRQQLRNRDDLPGDRPNSLDTTGFYIMMYSPFSPPLVLLLFGLLAAIAAGAAFSASLKDSVNAWMQSGSGFSPADLKRPELLVPYTGICFGVLVFLAAGLEMFGTPRLLAYVVALPLTLFTAWLVWSQLGKLILQLRKGGSRALDLDSL
ncbi:hypothetical protein KR51_00010340 [Rubidibacter lacunae KORDI 51-2]|uniref:Uncharacterized protein n=1 Tax=Rubidibacter lacunae KORDI 51-2 TaxID=582515 RepID=U5DKT9_9CHRO|nr:hypothetical protein [Rubidibacter lacunae]ERN42306.1 hypothetical protein KR51_00010340 [Rubidibacter lacunae KORDI 51-2]